MKKQVITRVLSLLLLAVPAMSLAAVTGTGSGATVGAANATGSLIATATVSAKCIITSTTNIVFASIDPTINGNYDGTGTIVTKCSKGTLEFLFIAPSVVGPLAMKSPTTLDVITYGLFTDVARTILFPGVTGGAKTNQPGTPVTTNVFGRVVVASGVNDSISAASDYTQALIATVEW